MPAAWKSFLILPVFYSLCSISRQVPGNLTSHHQTCLPPSTSAVASSVQVLIFVVFSWDLTVKAVLTTSYVRQSHSPWWQRCDLTQFLLKPFQATLPSTEWGQDRVAMVPPALTLPPSLFPTSQPSTFCALIIPSSWLFPRKILPRLHMFAPTIFYTLPLKVWTMDQQHQHHPRAYYWIRIHVLTKSPGDSIHIKILECFFHLLCPCCLHALEMECPPFYIFFKGILLFTILQQMLQIRYLHS